MADLKIKHLTNIVVNLRIFFIWIEWNICLWWNMLIGKF